MAHGHALEGWREPAHATSASILGWTVVLSGGKLWMTAPPGEDAAAATSNLTAQEIVEIHLPAIVEHKPAIVLVGPLFTNGGPNRGALRTVVESIQSYGGVPVLLTEFPSGGGSGNASMSRTYISRENVWIKRYAGLRGVPVVDAYSVLVDPSTPGHFKSELSNDGLHQNSAGSRVVAELVVETLRPMLEATPGVPLAQSGEADLLTNQNPLNLAGAGPATPPTGWKQTNGSGLVRSDETAPFGNWLTAIGSGGGLNVTSTMPLPVGQGDRLLLAFRVSADPADADGVAKLTFRPPGGGSLAGISFTRDFDGIYAGEWTYAGPSGDGGELLLQALGDGTRTSVSQITLINLTDQQILSP